MEEEEEEKGVVHKAINPKMKLTNQVGNSIFQMLQTVANF